MTAFAKIVRKSRPHRAVLHAALLASASMAALLTAAPDAHGRSLGGGSASGPSQTAVLAAQRRRDERDETREHSALRPAADAVELDTTGRSEEEVVARVVALARERGLA